MIVSFGTHVQKDDISSNISQFFKIVFFFFGGGGLVGKSAKNVLKLPISVCHALYLKKCRSYHGDFWYTGVN